MRIFMKPALVAVAMLLAAAPAANAASDPDALARALDQVNRRLDELERQNQQLASRVDELTKQNESLRAAGAAAAPVPSSAVPSAHVAKADAPNVTPADEWASRIKFGGDFRFRTESIDNSLVSADRHRDTVRARMSAAIRISDSIKGEIGIGTGTDPRGGSLTLGEASSRKQIGLDLAYMSWRPIDELTLTAGKMREPYVRPGRSQFFDNEIRPEGLALNYRNSRGLFGSAFDFWLEERALISDSKLRGGQIGWDGELGAAKVKVGAGYYDYYNVQGRFPGFGNGIVSEFGNTIIGTGVAARFAYDYDIGQLFAETTIPVAGIPLNLFADYGHNFDADNGLDTAYSFGFLIGKANRPGQWEAGVLTQKVEKDALFAQWTDSDYASGVTDNDGYTWRLAWMAMKNVLLNVTYYDTHYNVDVGTEQDYDRWQLDFNFTF